MFTNAQYEVFLFLGFAEATKSIFLVLDSEVATHTPQRITPEHRGAPLSTPIARLIRKYFSSVAYG